MPGVLGAITTSADTRPASILDRLDAGSTKRPWGHIRRVDAGGCSLAAFSLGSSQKIIETSACVLAYQGEIFLDPTTSGERQQKTDGGGTAGMLASRYLAHGVDALCGLNGLYVIAVFDKEKRTLTLVSDRYGFCHLYYSHQGGTLVFADEVQSLLNYPKTPRAFNFETIEDILTVGYPLSDRTLFSSVSLLPGASVLTFNHASCSLRTYWEYEIAGKVLPHDRRDVEAEAWDLLGRSLALRTAPRICVPITGGLDSRAVTGALLHFTPDAEVVTDTIGPDECIDVVYGRLIAARLGVPHRHFKLGLEYIAHYGPEIVRRLGGEASVFTGWVLAQDDMLADFGHPVFMSGFLGGSLSGSRLPVSAAGMEDKDEVLKSFYAHGYERVFTRVELQALLRPDVFARVSGSAFASIAQSFRDARGDTALDRCDCVDLCQRQRRFTCTHIALHSVAATLRDPFVDNAYADFFFQLPPSFRLKQRTYLNMIKRFLPSAAALPRSTDSLPLNATPLSRKLAPVKDEIARTGRRIRRAIGLRAGETALVRGCFDIAASLRTDSRSYVTDLLGNSQGLPTLVDRGAMNAILEEHMSGRRNRHYQICALATLAETFRQFGE